MQSAGYSCPILMKLEFSRQIFEKASNINFFMKIRPVGAKLFHAEGRAYMTELIVAFRDFENAPKNESIGNVTSVCQSPCLRKN